MPNFPIQPDGKRDRKLTEYDDKMRSLDLWRMELVPPDVGIFDEPARCYRLNNEWAKIVIGLVSWLADTPVWRDAENEGYPAIEQILKFMIGQPCMIVRQQPENPCILESSVDGGENWVQFADILQCITSDFIEQSITNAINNSADLRDLISGATTGLPDVPGDMDKINFPAFNVPSCDNDVIYGYCKALWQYIDAKTVDFLQQMAEWTNAFGLIDQLLQLIPGYELLPIDDVQDWIESFGDYNFEAYQSEKTVELEQEIICDLWCLAVNNGCTLNFGDVYNYFVGKIGGLNVPTVVATFSEWVFFMASGDYPNDRIVYLWSAFQLTLAFVGQEFLGQRGIERYAIQAQTGDPDNDWELLCDECIVDETYLITFDVLSEAEWAIDYVDRDGVDYTINPTLQNNEQGNATPSAKSGRTVLEGQPSNTGFGQWLEITLADISTVSAVSFEYYWIQDVGISNVLGRGIELYDATDTLLDSTKDSGNNATREDWTEFPSDFGSVENVKTILVYVARNGPGGIGDSDCWIDNISVTVNV